jgi:hypothetical protein
MSIGPDDFEPTPMTDDELAEFERQLELRGQVTIARIEAIQREFERFPRAEVFDLETMLERFAYVEGQDIVVDLKDPAVTHSLQGFRNKTRGSFRTIVGSRGSERHVPIADDWLEHPARIDLKGATFRPNAPRVTVDLAGRTAYNTWSPPAVASFPLPQDWQQRAEVFDAHMFYLIPNDVERANVVRWLAHRVQRPEVLPGWHVLLIANNAQGTGRNWLARMMKVMLSEYVIEALPLKRILEGNFNGEIDRGLLGVVDEIREGGQEYWKHAEALKSFLTEKTRVINQKYRATYEVENYLAVLMFSNHIAALPLDQTDRRVYVAECAREPRDAAYYDYIYGKLKDPATVRSIHETLMTVNLSGFEIEGRAPASDLKHEMIRGNTSSYEALLAELAAEWPSDVIRLSRLNGEMNAKIDADYPFGLDRPKGLVPTGAARNNIYNRLGMKGDLRPTMDVKQLDGKMKRDKTSVVVLRRWHEHWKAIAKSGALEQLAAEAERGERDAPSS